MSKISQYIFRAGELYVLKDNTLPAEIPSCFADMIQDSLDLCLVGQPSRAILLKAPNVSVNGATSNGYNSNYPESLDDQAPGTWTMLRELISSSDSRLKALAAPAFRSLGLLNWHSTTRFCAACGSPLSDHPKELARLCPNCRTIVYPRISPAIIVLVQKDDMILLARHSYRNQNIFSCLAGFLEHGETLEECVAREVYEETKLKIDNIRYAGSQSWPYPDQFMTAFYADWKSGEIHIDPAELLEAKWFKRTALPSHPGPGTVAWRLIHGDFLLRGKN